MTQEKLAVTVSEAAALVAVSRSSGYALVASGEWPSIMVGRSIRVPVEALRAWVEHRMRDRVVAPKTQPQASGDFPLRRRLGKPGRPAASSGVSPAPVSILQIADGHGDQAD
jgi:excisionase family DNA binding protein